MAWLQTVGVQIINALNGTTAGITTTSGSSLAFAVTTSPGFGGDLDATTPVSDSYGNVWTLQATGTASGGNKQRIYTAQGITGGAGHTFTINFAALGYGDINVGESSNTGALDGAGVAGTDAGFSHAGASFTATAGADWFQGQCSDSILLTQTQTAGAGWTKGSFQTDGNNGTAAFCQYRDSLSSGSATSPFSTGDGVNSVWAAVGFKAGGGGGPSTTHLTLTVSSSSSVAIIKRAGKHHAVTSATSLVLKRGIAKTFPITGASSFAFAQGLLKKLTFAITAAASVAFSERKVFLTSSSVTSANTVGLVKRIGKGLAVSTANTVALARKIARTFSVTSAATVALSERLAFNHTASITGAATVALVVSKLRKLSFAISSATSVAFTQVKHLATVVTLSSGRKVMRQLYHFLTRR